VVGEKYPDTISSIAELAAIYYTQGRYNKAEILKKQALDLRQEVVRENHPDIISSIAELAAIYYT
jgi:tetratricopeptide (TPR) repeat protein